MHNSQLPNFFFQLSDIERLFLLQNSHLISQIENNLKGLSSDKVKPIFSLDTPPCIALRQVKGMWVTQYPITQSQWASVVGKVDSIGLAIPLYPSAFRGKGYLDCPVTNICVHDILEWIKRLNTLNTGGTYSLLTEKEWVLIAEENPLCSKNPLDYAWLTDNSQNRTHPVGTKLPTSKAGLYDLWGNVWEVVESNNSAIPYFSVGGCFASVVPTIHSRNKALSNPAVGFRLKWTSK